MVSARKLGPLLDCFQRVQEHVLHRCVRSRKLRRARDRLKPICLGQFANARTVAGDDDARKARRCAGMVERVRDDRPPQQRQQVLVGQADATRAGEDDTEYIHF
jgi:hypothetical protein